MRSLAKLSKPQVLTDNEQSWREQYQMNPQSDTNKTRYRHADIKSKLIEETCSKCIYCESKIGHNTPGDIEHKKPISKFPEQAFDWENLTIACTECNRRKNDYYSSNDEDRFIDPYRDNVEEMFIHHGPVLVAKPDQTKAEISAKLLEINGTSRVPLILRKIEKINDVDERVKRLNLEQDAVLKTVLKKALLELTDKKEEYSGMIIALLESYGISSN